MQSYINKTSDRLISGSIWMQILYFALGIQQNLVPFDKLSENTKNYDYNALAKMPSLLRKYCNLDIVHK